MIEVIKHGKKKFNATCLYCGCEFTYEIEDAVGGWVICPDCSRRVPHQPAYDWINTTPTFAGTEQATTTNTDKSKVVGTLYGVQGDMYNTEKDLEIHQALKEQASKTLAIKCDNTEWHTF